MTKVTSARSKRRVFAVAVGAALAAVLFFGPHRSWAAASDQEIREQVSEVLQQRHPTDTPEWWRGLGANAPRVIIAMVGEEGSTYKKLRLLGGLGAFDTPEAAEFLRKQAEDARESVVRTTAIRSLGASQGAKELDTISKFLQHDDAQTRLAAAQTLEKMNDPRAKDAFERYAREEKVPWVRQRLKGELPKPRGVLTPVASSEDRLSPDFSGEWKGYLLFPRKPQEPGMKSQEAALTLRAEPSGTSASGDLRVQGAPGTTEKNRVFRLEGASGKGIRLSGKFAEQVPQGARRARPSPVPDVLGSELAFEAELSQENGNTLIVARSRGSGAVLVLRRSPQ